MSEYNTEELCYLSHWTEQVMQTFLLILKLLLKMVCESGASCHNAWEWHKKKLVDKSSSSIKKIRKHDFLNLFSTE